MNQGPETYYYPQPAGQMPAMAGQRRGRTQQACVYPRWLMQYAMAAYILALAVVTFMYFTYSLPWYYMLSGVVSVSVFFLYGRKLAQETAITKVRKEKRFEKRIFWIAFTARFLWMVLIYTIFMQTYGDPFGFDNADAMVYDEVARDLSSGLRKGHVEYEKIFFGMDISDRGYGTYLGFIYWLTNDSVFFSRLLKCLWSSLTVVLLYRLAARNFGTQTGRIAAVFCALWPNFWYYCGCQLKETEMVFLTVLYIEQTDQMLRSRKFTAWKVIPVLLIAAALFTFRTPLGFVAILALLFSAVMSSTKVVSWSKRIIVGVLAVALVGVVAGNRLEERARGLMEQVEDGYQEGNMAWRATRVDAGGRAQTFAKYAGKAVFAPLIMTIPFPTMVQANAEQHVQQLLNGGNFIKNILSGLVILAFVTLLLSGRWREYSLPLSFVLGYLLVLTVSAFAQSERFHQPAMAFELMFAAYGLSVVLTKKKYKQWFMYWCVLMFVAAIAWSWFKLAGRGMV